MERDHINHSDDAELHRILALATEPEPPDGAAGRLLAQVSLGDSSNVVPFRQPTRPRALGYAALPLAASLLIGVYLGAMGGMDWLLPETVTGEVADGSDVVDDLGGVGEAEEYVEENLS